MPLKISPIKGNIKMIFIFFWLTILFLTNFSTTSALYSQAELQACYKECGVTHDPMPEAMFRSIGGSDAPEHDYPWVVLLVMSTLCPNGNGQLVENRCTGFIANNQLIVTAGHCLSVNHTDILVRCGASKAEIDQYDKQIHWYPYRRNQIKIYFGYTNLDAPKQKEGSSFAIGGAEIDRIVFADRFVASEIETGMLLKYDYAVIKLRISLIFDEDLRPICLTRAQLQTPYRQHYGYMSMAGWGRKKEDDPPTKVMQVVTVPVQEGDECLSNLKKLGFNELNHMCAGGRDRGGEEGDSGSPLMLFYNERMYVVGMFIQQTTQTQFRNARPDVFIRTNEMCDLLKNLNGNNEVCHKNLEGLSRSCASTLQEKRMELALKACGNDNNENKPIKCDNKANSAKLKNNAQEIFQNSDEIDHHGKMCKNDCPAGYLCVRLRCRRRCQIGLKKCPFGGKCNGMYCEHEDGSF